jgi:hypothetical protein
MRSIHQTYSYSLSFLELIVHRENGNSNLEKTLGEVPLGSDVDG